MKRSTYLFVAVIGALIMAGCAPSKPVTVRYDRATNQTFYEARDISVGTMFEGYGINSSVSIDLRAWANCRGRGCTPDKIWLGFVAPNPAENIQIGTSSVRMRTDEEQYIWRERGGLFTERDVTYVRGLFTRVAVSLSELEDIATAERVSGRIGQESFELSYEDRAPLRELLERVGTYQ